MNKITKGAVVGGIGVALLLGGGSTLAYWTDQAPVSGAAITSGSLDISDFAAATWTVTNNGTTKPVANIATFKMVPGDTLTYSTTATVTLVGDNLKATIAAAPGAGSITTPGELKDRLQTTAEVNGGATAEITAGTHTVPVTVTIVWPFGDASSPTLDNEAMNETVSFANFNVTLTQVQ
ncbi:alternate-type signal peptide domain-containing protein [Flavimobilis sp. GY10621]|uniref:Alternate-type signal peptide domain-containing protein n=1 Tax=Flavimobilis rhizosphaerae TaxID=2775421 RepID=A0ABR9DSN9_9MICO|nr:alternate-type signal peptide domain-containing protein [Flavimobilis rhizosphaerae]MBD9699342.1 alternate-type signal peptide domain-containing protein [Flavimobilis rhizosphaerae]